MSEQKSDLINLTGLWKKTSKNGKEFYSGRLGNANVMVFIQEHKKTDKHPDATLCFSPYVPKEKNEGNGATPPPDMF